jgi:hypothetical protein
MVSFDQSLTELVLKKMVTYAEAAANASNSADFALTFRGVVKGGSISDSGPEPASPPPPTPQGTGTTQMQIERFKPE